ncbi:TonB-dependent receptor plug domain-containing protein [Flavobacteriaceae bacterium AH-315-B10]|nr:TonB-dependent receptor plug domain-containing protein [Flavobacteriaceae bacterium AH-315-B10]
MEYLIKASAIIAIFYLCYSLFLQRDTFFQSNRWFFVVGLITAILIPLVVIPIYITVQPQEFVYSISNLTFTNENTVIPFDWNGVLTTIYFLGVSVFAARLLIQIYSLVSLIIRNKKHRSGKFIYVEVEDNISPFSFFNWIVFNPNQFKQTELEQIITHEKVHANQFHSIDILLIKIASVVFWCNPLIWFYKKELHQNLEFIADNEAQKQASCEKSYQHLLLKTSMPNYQMALTNNFYNSLIKKRIVMLHKNKSKNRNYWKFALILPLLALFIMSFNTKEIYIEEELPIKIQSDLSSPLTLNDINYLDKSLVIEEENLNTENEKKQEINTIKTSSVAKTNSIKTTSKTIDVIITKDYSEADFIKIKKEFEDAGFTLKFKGIKRNNNGEIIAIKIDASSEKSNANFNINSDEPIEPIKITVDTESNSISIGNGMNIHLVNSKDYGFFSKDDKHKIHKSGKGNNVFVFESDEENEHEHKDENVFIIKKDVKIHEIKNVHKGKSIFVISGDNGESTIIRDDIIKLNGNVVIKDKKVHVIHGDDNSIFELKGDDNSIFELKGKHKEGKVIINGNSVIWNHDDKNIWTTDKDNNFIIKSLGKGNNKIFISGGNGNNPIFILDGKEVSKKKLDDLLDPNDIKEITVLKGEKAIKKYGKKAKDGAIVITTKKKE